MRLIQTKSRHQRSGRRTPRIAISQDEITADLTYRGASARIHEAATARRGRR